MPNQQYRTFRLLDEINIQLWSPWRFLVISGFGDLRLRSRFWNVHIISKVSSNRRPMSRDMPEYVRRASRYQLTSLSLNMSTSKVDAVVSIDQETNCRGEMDSRNPFPLCARPLRLPFSETIHIALISFSDVDSIVNAVCKVTVLTRSHNNRFPALVAIT